VTDKGLSFLDWLVAEKGRTNGERELHELSHREKYKLELDTGIYYFGHHRCGHCRRP